MIIVQTNEEAGIMYYTALDSKLNTTHAVVYGLSLTLHAKAEQAYRAFNECLAHANNEG